MTKYKEVKRKPKEATKIVMRRDDYPKKGYETWYYANKNFTKYWKVAKLKHKKKKEEKTIKIKPNVTQKEVMKSLESAEEVPDGYGHLLKRYKKGNWLYTMQQIPSGPYLIAYYLPSMSKNKGLKIMYHWDRPTGKNWELLTYRVKK